MTPEQREQLFEHLDRVNSAAKSIDAMSQWYKVFNRPTGRLEWQAALKLDGSLGGGVSARFATPVNAWDADLYGQLDVKVAFLPRPVRLNPVEWRPRRAHTNPASAPEGLALETFLDRWHPYKLNRGQDIKVFLQGAVGIAEALPYGISSFSDYLRFCATVWKCPDIERVPPPPWSRSLV